MNPLTSLEGLTNPHFATDAKGDAPPHEVRYRERMRTPAEEYAARVAEHGPLQKAPKGLVALMLQQKQVVTIQRNGITIKRGRPVKTVRYWSAESATTQSANVGKRVAVGLDPDDDSVIYVYNDKGGLADVVPQKGKVAWFDEEGWKAQAEQTKVHNRDRAELQRLHTETDQQRGERNLRNHERQQAIQTFPAEGERQDAEPMPEADRIAAAREAIAAQRSEHERMEARAAARRSGERNRMAEVIPDRSNPSRLDAEPLHRSDARLLDPEEDEDFDRQTAALEELT